MPWLQLALIAPREQLAPVETALEAAGALSVTLDDPQDTQSDGAAQAPGDLALLEPAPGDMPLWPLVRITALFADNPQAAAHARQVADELADVLAAPAHLTPLADQVWERAWLAHWRAQRFGQRLWVCPRTRAPEAAPEPGPGADAAVVMLDPGLAFGTGTHPTTALCLEWLDSLELTGKTLIDYGCGSGILAIAALKLGAARVIAIDHDPQAREATRANALANGVAERLDCLAPEDRLGHAGLRADALVANILAPVLIDLAADFGTLCTAHAAIALSGILEPQLPAVHDAYRAWIDFDPPITREQWVLLAGRRRTSRGHQRH